MIARFLLPLALFATVAQTEPYGMIGKITAKAGQRDALAAVLAAGTGAMPGNRAYLVAKDLKQADVLWVTEAWDSRDAHRASLALPAVKAAIARGLPLIADFETVAETEPAGR